MIVDDSSIVRALYSKALAKESSIKIVACAQDGEEAVRLAKKHQPQIIILDVEMPIMDGITALPLILEGSPNSEVIMASRLTQRSADISIKALKLGAADYIPKPELDELDKFYDELIVKIKTLSKEAFEFKKPESLPIIASKPNTPVLKPSSNKKIQALAIAASTGGPQTILKIITELKGKLNHIPIFITQHMPATFTTVFAEHVALAGGKPCHEGHNNEVVQPNHIYIAPGDYHMIAKKSGADVIIETNKDPHVNFCRPAADPMFESLSSVYGAGLFAVVLTGMGHDGAAGAKIIHQNGGAVIAQDAATSVVYGMPKAVAEKGICEAVLPLSDIANYIIRRCS
jgi:two-component system chemotaxis response regulator CheB